MSKTWGDVFNFYKHQGHNPNSAAVKADEWGDWQAGTRLNLERSLRLGDELGGQANATVRS